MDNFQVSQEGLKKVFTGGIRYEDDASIKRTTIWAIVIVAVILIFIVMRKKIKDVLSGTATKSVNYLTPTEVHGCVTPSWLKSGLVNFVTSLKKELEVTHYNPLGGGERCELYKKVNELNNNQIIAIANTYKKRFGKSLAQHMSEQSITGCGILGTDEGQLLAERLNKLQLA